MTHRLITAGRSFTVNLWSSDDTKVFVKFSKPATFDAEAMTLNGRPVRAGHDRRPDLRRSRGVARLHGARGHDLGTHTLFVGEVVDAGVNDDESPAGGDERHPHEVRRRQATLTTFGSPTADWTAPGVFRSATASEPWTRCSSSDRTA